jgi:hypothetical protein
MNQTSPAPSTIANHPYMQLLQSTSSSTQSNQSFPPRSSAPNTTNLRHSTTTSISIQKNNTKITQTTQATQTAQTTPNCDKKIPNSPTKQPLPHHNLQRVPSQPLGISGNTDGGGGGNGIGFGGESSKSFDLGVNGGEWENCGKCDGSGMVGGRGGNNCKNKNCPIGQKNYQNDANDKNPEKSQQDIVNNSSWGNTGSFDSINIHMFNLNDEEADSHTELISTPKAKNTNFSVFLTQNDNKNDKNSTPKQEKRKIPSSNQHHSSTLPRPTTRSSLSIHPRNDIDVYDHNEALIPNVTKSPLFSTPQKYEQPPTSPHPNEDQPSHNQPLIQSPMRSSFSFGRTSFSQHIPFSNHYDDDVDEDEESVDCFTDAYSVQGCGDDDDLV